MTIRVTDARVLGNGDLDIDYVHPNDPDISTHHHIIPMDCIKERIVVYGVGTLADAVEQVILEVCAREFVDPNRYPARAERLAAHNAHGPVAGLQAALKKSGASIPVPTEDDVVAIKGYLVHHFGTEGIERARGVAAGTIKHCDCRQYHCPHWPRVADPHAVPHPKTPV